MGLIRVAAFLVVDSTPYLSIKQSNDTRKLMQRGLHTDKRPSLGIANCPQGLVVAIGAANFALSEVQADFLHRKGYNLMFILCVLIKAIGYLLCAVSVLSSFFYELYIWV